MRTPTGLPLAVCLGLGLASLLPPAAPALADGIEDVALPVSDGCLGIASYGIAMFDSGAGSVTVDPPGAILGVYIHWVGVEDTTPAGDGTSTVTINGTPVAGTLSAGAAGYAPTSDWYSWWANIGPAAGPFAGSDLVSDSMKDVAVSGWDSPSEATNGATVTVIYDTGACIEPNSIELHMGVDWYFHGHSGEERSELLIFDFVPVGVDRVVSFQVGHAGTDATQTSCRGGSVWMLAGTGATPGPTDFHLVELGSGGAGFGVNGGVEIVNDPFTSPSMPCVPAVNPAPDEPYEPGHPCPAGAAGCAYHALALRPAAGGDVGAEWGVVEIDALVPAGSAWVAFQLESEKDQAGESGSWAGSSFVLSKLPECGDGVLDPGEACDDGDTDDGDGCSSDCTLDGGGGTDSSPMIACAPCILCNDPGECSAAFDCSSVAVAIDPEGAAVELVCSPPGPYPVGTTDVTVTASDGVNEAELVCSLTVRDCEPPVCDPPLDIDLECSGECGIDPSDPAVAAFLGGASGADNCALDSVLPATPAVFGSACGAGATSSVVFVATDEAGYQASCSAAVTVHDTLAPMISCPEPLLLECLGEDGVPLGDPAIGDWMGGASASDLCGAVSLTNDAPDSFPSGCDATGGTTTEVTFTATDGCGNVASCVTEVTVVDTLPPTGDACGIHELCLWPPNHKYVCFDEVSALVRLEDACDAGAVTVTGVSCVSDQCDDAPCDEYPDQNGDGSTDNDCTYDPLTDTVCARSERAGTNPEGRSYSVSVVAVDACGNESEPFEALTIFVPHDMSDHDQCIAPSPKAPK